MKWSTRMVLALCLMAWGVAMPSEAALRVVAATTDLGAIARAVGGEEIRIDVVARPDRDPHTVEVRPSTMRMAATADIYLEVGLSLDLWSKDIVRGSRNRNLMVVDCAEAIEPLEVPSGRVDASMGDVHPEGNPHYWLDPLNAGAVARLLAERFSIVDPEHAQMYRANAERFAGEIERRMPTWEEGLRGRTFIEYHRSWIYLARRFGMTIVAQVEPLPGIPPSARHLAELADTIRRENVSIVVRDFYHSDSPLAFLSRETGVRTAVMSSSCEEPTPESYLALFDHVVEVLGGAR
jgi:zinc/manganese transport system substrate-binding protein